MRNTTIFFFSLLLFGCKASYIQERNFIMKNNNNIDSSLIINQLDIEGYYKNKGNDHLYIYYLEDGTKIEMGDANFRKSEGEKYRTFTIVTTPAKPRFYLLSQTYYHNGMIKARGCLLPYALTIGIWEYYDEQGNKTEINEDIKLPDFTYNDVLLFLHKKKLINIYTGEHREKITINYYENPSWKKKPKPIWVVDWMDKEKTFTQIIYHLDAMTGKVIGEGKANSGSETVIIKPK